MILFCHLGYTKVITFYVVKYTSISFSPLLPFVFILRKHFITTDESNQYAIQGFNCNLFYIRLSSSLELFSCFIYSKEQFNIFFKYIANSSQHYLLNNLSFAQVLWCFIYPTISGVCMSFISRMSILFHWFTCWV